jgi:hypothetical protein
VARPDLAWILAAPGCPPVQGGLADLRPRTVVQRGRTIEVLHADVVLERGEERTILVTGDDERPLAGAVITLDGVPFGTTDARGLAAARRNAWPPRACSVELGDWEFAYATWESEEEAEDPLQRVWMERP